jgi:hypothetical protein
VPPHRHHPSRQDSAARFWPSRRRGGTLRADLHTDATQRTGDHGRARQTLARLVQLARAVADADPSEIESTAHQLGASRRYLAPVAWAAGTLVLLFRGIKLLLLNWRLTLVELVPAVWVWVVMWDLKHHALRGDAFRQISLGDAILLVALTIAASTAAFWCNTVFAFAITHPQPRIAPAMRQATRYLARIVLAGIGMGVVLAAGAVFVPRIGSLWLYLVASIALYSLMLISFVAVPARILGAKKQKLRPKQAIGSWTVGGALSAVAMTPGFVLDRVGLILLGVQGLHLVGLVLLSIGTALYAAGMSSVKAVKLSMKLDAPAIGTRPP